MKLKRLRSRKVALVPSVWNLESETSAFTKKMHGICLKKLYLHQFNFTFNSAVIEDDWNNVGRFVLKRIIRDEKYIPNIYKKQKAAGLDMVSFYKKIRKMDLKKKSLKELLELYKKAKEKWLIFDEINILPWFIAGDFMNEHLCSLLKEKGLNESEIQTMLTAPERSFSMDEEKGFLEILLEIKKKKLETKIEMLPESIIGKIRKLSGKYHWIPFGYDGPEIYDVKYYLNHLKENFGKNVGEIEEKLNKINDYEKEMHLKQKEIVLKYSIPKNILRLLSDFYGLAMMTDERKVYHFQLHISISMILTEISKRLGLSLVDIKHIMVDELIKYAGDPKKLKKISKERQAHPIIVVNEAGKKYKILTGKEMEKLAEQIFQKSVEDYVKGSVASLGAKVFGVVKVVLHPREISKVNKGDILVSTMTTPEYVPAMRKAIAIVTDEGGVTCHAAIVSRELGIPCIIGTKNATKTFKDGDHIEVDTKQGIAKKVKK